MTKLPKSLRIGIRLLVGFVVIFLVYIVITLVHGTLNDYQPEAIIPLEAAQEAEIQTIEDSLVSFVTWNVGYGGLGAESDFFYDSGSLHSGGKNVITPKPQVEKNVKGATDFASHTKSDFFLFQEVDVNSRRSYRINQFDGFRASLPEYAAFFAQNYKVSRVPIPVLEPWNVIGEINSGLATFSRFQPTESTRYQLPGEYDWPTRIFQLDRCASVHRFNTAWGKELVVVNVHNSAYDAGGGLKKQQMAWLKDFFQKEYEAGKYVIVGGDWNQCPPNFPFDQFMPGKGQGYTQINIKPDFLPADWQWIYDPRVPTNRKVADPYVKNATFVTLIDFFLVSPNVQVKKIKGLNQDFQYSDHQPVYIEAELLK